MDSFGAFLLLKLDLLMLPWLFLLDLSLSVFCYKRQQWRSHTFQLESLEQYVVLILSKQRSRVANFAFPKMVCCSFPTMAHHFVLGRNRGSSLHKAQVTVTDCVWHAGQQLSL